MSTIPYANAMGNLIHATTSTKLHIAFAMNYRAQFMAHLRPIHWYVVKHIFHYFQGTSTYGWLYSGANASI